MAVAAGGTYAPGMTRPAPQRPPEQRWIKRPPRPSRPQAAAPPARRKPGMPQFLMALALGLVAGVLGAVLAQGAGLRPGMPGFVAGAGFCLGFIALWRGLGGTVQDIKDLFR